VPMEQEVMPMLIAGVCVVIFLSFFIVIGQWVVTKYSAHGWITAHLVVLSSVFTGGYTCSAAPTGPRAPWFPKTTPW